MVSLHNSIGRIENLLSFAKTRDERAAILHIVNGLQTDANSIFSSHKIKKIKGINGKAFEIIKGNLRIFYTTKNNVIIILHISRKQKNKTEQKDLNLVEKRVKNM
ncbi:type II toxin-antitoxin system RelE/ParE family toxin [Paeniclostridium sordellii]|uniref:type II toxin-antitoxin system RelE/ParE family toxin n=1 Tax=Paraclostridium sordellii TaxID=1505 RepID=UPI00210E139C|nr:type II toxin-antitoxin system RelE/ParE family toxin [Paeniclostridium sordellii]MCQ4699175.1 type II toxin-antitoxin system RelE/ParE family toxin [Paeniclostridium sordellii]